MTVLFLLTPLLRLLLIAPPTPAQLVVPGRRLGSLTLGADAATLATLGPAAYGDAAMQKAWATWFGTGHPPAQLDVYTTMIPGQDTHKSVRVVRATSTYFRLANGLRNGSTLRQIQGLAGVYADAVIITRSELSRGEISTRNMGGSKVLKKHPALFRDALKLLGLEALAKSDHIMQTAVYKT
ncbi:MAG: hypothetical protein EOO63_05105, partial [Hymenobacter sp.]